MPMIALKPGRAHRVCSKANNIKPARSVRPIRKVVIRFRIPGKRSAPGKGVGSSTDPRVHSLVYPGHAGPLLAVE